MTTVVKALDILQGEEHTYLGTLLPTIAVCLHYLRQQKLSNLLFYKSLVDYLIKVIHK